ncbi:MAG: RIP metalloprotease RseP [Candidatus Omnitrophica bacterium]|nr:RIP metalloprotease RseP [Candidatus Omnitrophota bacterium]MDD5437176.1 RIP metalloprotease RseP [Candidatus Omnitrophota bacterium]
MLSLIYFIIVLGVLILVHEFGHFITAKHLGVRVDRFSIGFGPKICSVRKGETEYVLSAIPLGGYISMAGEDPSQKVTGQKWEFLSRSVFDRFKIIFAGPLLNYILAFVIFSVIFMFGSPTMTTEVGSLLKDYPAELQGIKTGDRILSVDGQKVKYWEDMTEVIRKHTEGSMALSILRGGAIVEMKIMPTIRKTKDIFGNETTVALIGIGPSQSIEKVRYGFFKSIAMGFDKLIQLTAITYKALWSILTGKLSLKESMTGPIGIFVITGQAAKMGFIYILHLMGILSASLAIFNVLPFPVLDGGHMLFLAIEKVRGKPISLKAQEVVMNIGVSLLILFTIFVFYSDIMKFGIAEKAMKLFKH